MSKIGKVISTMISDKIAKIKFLGSGKSDVQEKNQIAPFGIDSNPIKDMIAIYMPTSEIGREVVVGYINKNQIADIGEIRIHSTDADGNDSISLHLKNDGTAEFGGDSDFMVRYSALETAFNELKADFNSLVTKYNSHIHPFVGLAAGVPGFTTPTTTTETPSTADITGAKIDEIKTS